jgi:lactoylglutathione lyase
MRINYAIVFVSDMGRAVSFYRDTLGLPLKFETPQWTEFATGGATLALHVAKGRGAAEDPSAEPPPGRCRTGFSVPDLDAFHARMIANAVPCVQEPTAVFGARVAQYVDPDGMVLSIGEERSH